MTEMFYRSSLFLCSVKPSELVKECRCDYWCWSQLSLTLPRLLITWSWSILFDYCRGNTEQKHVLNCSLLRMLQRELEQEAKGAHTSFSFSISSIYCFLKLWMGQLLLWSAFWVHPRQIPEIIKRRSNHDPRNICTELFFSMRSIKILARSEVATELPGCGVYRIVLLQLHLSKQALKNWKWLSWSSDSYWNMQTQAIESCSLSRRRENVHMFVARLAKTV